MGGAIPGQLVSGCIRKHAVQATRSQDDKQHSLMVSASVPASEFLSWLFSMDCDQGYIVSHISPSPPHSGPVLAPHPEAPSVLIHAPASVQPLAVAGAVTEKRAKFGAPMSPLASQFPHLEEDKNTSSTLMDYITWNPPC